MKIALVFPSFYPTIGGIETYMKSLAEEYAALGHSVTIFTSDSNYAGTPAHSWAKNCDVTYLESKKFLGYAIPQKKVLEKIRADVIHLNMPHPYCSVIAWRMRKTGIPVIATYHGNANPKSFVKWMVARAEMMLYRFFFARIIVTTQLYKEKIAPFYPARSVSVIPLGVNGIFAASQITKAEARAQLGIPNEQKTVMFAGAMDDSHLYKGISTLLECAKRSAEIKYLLIGGGSRKESYQNIAHSLELNNVEFIEPVSPENLQLYYKSADVFVLPSTSSSEGFGLVLLEAMSCGTPVITTDCAGSKDFIHSSGAGLIVKAGNPHDLKNAIVRIMEDHALAHKFGSNGHRIAKEMTWKKTAGETLNVYEETIKQAASKSTGSIATKAATQISQAGRTKVNFILSHKSEIYIKDSTPSGERRIFDDEFLKAIAGKVELNEIHLYKPFNARTHFTQNVANVLYHIKNLFAVSSRADKNAISHIFFGEEASILRFLRLKKTVVTCLDIIPISYPGSLSWHYRLFYRMCVKGLKKADRILTVSEHTKKDLVKYLNIDPQKIRTAYWGISKIFRPGRNTEDFCKKYGLDPEKLFIVSVGALDSPRKNLSALIKTFPRVIAQIPQAELVIAGYKNDTTHSPLMDFIKKEGLESKIHILEKISDDDLSLLYNLASVFVFPTLYEGFGLPPVEAMCCGAPVIASNNSSLPEAVGGAGILINPLNQEELVESIVKVLSNEDLRRQLIEKGFTHAQKFSWSSYAEELIKTYRELEAADAN